jgi:hypothetical protein
VAHAIVRRADLGARFDDALGEKLLALPELRLEPRHGRLPLVEDGELERRSSFNRATSAPMSMTPVQRLVLARLSA